MTVESIKVGTRSSPLALWQANWVSARLRELGNEVELIHITTQGDVTQGPLDLIGGRGLFTNELQNALMQNRIDLAVHSLKDLPTEKVKGLKLGAIPVRETMGDVLITAQGTSVQDLPHNAIVGTGSMRRKSQLLNARPDLDIRDIRGNVDTRLRKLDDGEYDAIILAEAGLKRLELHDRIVHVISKDLMLPAVGQGALGLELRVDDVKTQTAVAAINDPASYYAAMAERTMLLELRGGCLAPVGAWGRVVDDLLHLDGVVLSGDGSQKISATACGPPERSTDIGKQVAAQLAIQGAERLISLSRNAS